MKITIEKKDKKIQLELNNSSDVQKTLEVFIAGLTGIGYEYSDVTKAIVKLGNTYKKYL